MGNEAAGEQDSEQSRRWSAWDDFIASKTNGGFRQSSWYAAFKVSYNGWSHFGTVLRAEESIVGGAVVFRRSFGSDSCYYYIPDGPVFLEDDSADEQEQVFDTIMDLIDRRRRDEHKVVSHLCINPRWEHLPDFVRGFQEARHYYGSPRNTQWVDLSASESEILAQMKPKGRYNIGVARRHGVSVVEDGSAQGLADFLDIYRQTIDRKGLGGLDDAYFRTLIPLLSASGCGSIFFAEHDGTRLATALVVYSGSTATYYYGGSRDVCRNMMAPYLLHFEIMRSAKSRGCLCYDFFGVTPQDAPPDAWTEISVFKRKFGGREVRLVPTLEYVYDAAAYEAWEAYERERRRKRRARRDVAEETAHSSLTE